MREANDVQDKEKREALQFFNQRDAALEKLDEWISDFKVIAMIALKEKP